MTLQTLLMRNCTEVERGVRLGSGAQTALRVHPSRRVVVSQYHVPFTGAVRGAPARALRIERATSSTRACGSERGGREKRRLLRREAAAPTRRARLSLPLTAQVVEDTPNEESANEELRCFPLLFLSTVASLVLFEGEWWLCTLTVVAQHARAAGTRHHYTRAHAQTVIHVLAHRHKGTAPRTNAPTHTPHAHTHAYKKNQKTATKQSTGAGDSQQTHPTKTKRHSAYRRLLTCLRAPLTTAFFPFFDGGGEGAGPLRVWLYAGGIYTDTHNHSTPATQNLESLSMAGCNSELRFRCSLA